MNAIERLKEYKQQLVQQHIEREKRLREEQLEKAQQIFADFKQNLPKEVRDLFVFGKAETNDDWASVDVTVGDVKFRLDYRYKISCYMAQFDDIPRDEVYWYAWDSKQPFEKLVDCILYAAEKKNRKVVEHSIVMGRTAAFV